MQTLQFLSMVVFALILPALALLWLGPVMRRILLALCGSVDGSEFWLRSATLLMLSGSLIMVMAFGRLTETVHEGTDWTWTSLLQRTLLLSLLGVFASVAVLSRTVRANLMRLLQTSEQAPIPAHEARKT